MKQSRLNDFLPICNRPRIVIFPRATRGRNCVTKLLEINSNLVGIVLPSLLSKEDKSLYSSINIEKHSLPPNESISGESLVEYLKKVTPDIIILAGFGRFLTSEIISLARIAVINLHAGKLPEYRGTSIVEWQIINGETQGGCSIHVVDKGIDTGPILSQHLFPIGPDVTGGEIRLYNQNIFPCLLADVIDKIEQGNARLTYQDESNAAYYSKRFPEDGIINWELMTAFQIHNLVRALTNQNGKGTAFTFNGDTRITIHKTSLIRKNYIGKAGRVLLDHPEGVLVMCSDRAILVKACNPQLIRGQKLG